MIILKRGIDILCFCVGLDLGGSQQISFLMAE